MGAKHRRDAMGGSVHAPTLLVGLAVAVAAVWLWATWPEDPTPAAPRVVAHAPDTDARAPAKTRGDAALPAPPRADARILPAASSPGTGNAAAARARPTGPRATLGGRVTRAADGTPVPGVRVTPELSRPVLVADECVAVTDADGRYRFVLDRDARCLELTVGAGPDTASRSRRVSLDLRLGADVTHDIEVSVGARLTGEVVDDAGRPVTDATVSAWSRRAHAVVDGLDRLEPDRAVAVDGAGRFVVDHVGPDFVLTASAPGRTELERLHGQGAEDGEIGGLRLTLTAPRAVTGSVTDRDGAPVPDAHVTAQVARMANAVTDVAGVYRLSPPPRSTGSDAAGAFTLADLPAVPVDVTVTAPDRVEWTGRHAPGDGPLDVRLARGTLLAGTVTDGTGRPVPGARLRLGVAPALDAADTAGGFASTDGAGRFAFEAQPAFEDGHLAVVADGFAVRVEQPVTSRPGQATDLRIALAPELVLAGRVVRTDGTPVPGAWLHIEGDRLVGPGDPAAVPRPTWEAEFPDLTSARTDADGRFRFESLYDGAFHVIATATGYPGLVVETEARAGQQDVTIVLDPDARWGVTLSGRAYDATTGRPATSFLVAPMSAHDGGLVSSDRSRVFDTDDGEWLLTGLQPGVIVLTVQAQGFAPWTAPPVEYAEGEVRVDVPLLPERTLRLRVVDGDRRPVSSANVIFRDAQGRALLVSHGPFSRTDMLSTDGQGELAAHGLPADRIVVEVKHGWLGPRREFPFDLRSEPNRVQEVVYDAADEPTLLVAVVRGGPEARALVESVLADAAASPVAARFDRASAAVFALTTHVDQGRLAPLGEAARLRLHRPDGREAAAFALERGVPQVVPPTMQPPEAPWLARVVGVALDARVELSVEGRDTTVRELRLDDEGGRLGLRVFLVEP